MSARSSTITHKARLWSSLAALALAAGSLVSGGVGCRRASSAFDCQAVCSRYRDCIDLKYDIGACRKRCRDTAIAETRFEQKADACESCIRGHSCMGATFECGSACLGVVP
jgi:hypothetical protein